MIHNPFASEVAARMYAAGRPDYSPAAREVMRRLLGTEPVDRAVDVGCGTGISTKMLAGLAREIVGVDSSPAMLDRAVAVPGARYLLGRAEELPLDDGVCDLITVGSAFHWFDGAAFLAETSRVAKPGARLVVHNHWFEGRMLGNEAFGEWANDGYLQRYPTPPRHRSWQPPADLGPWRHMAWERYEHPVELTAGELVAYLMTQSNVQVVLERRAEPESIPERWLLRQVAPFFREQAKGAFMFGGYVACHRRSEGETRHRRPR